MVQSQALRWRWVVADEACGGNPAFLEGVAGLGLWSFAAVPHSTRVWEARPATHVPPWRGRGRRPQRERLVEGAPAARTVLEVAAGLPAEAWARQTIQAGTQGGGVCHPAGGGRTRDLARASRLVGAASAHRDGGVEDLPVHCASGHRGGNTGAHERDAVAHRNVL